MLYPTELTARPNDGLKFHRQGCLKSKTIALANLLEGDYKQGLGGSNSILSMVYAVSAIVGYLVGSFPSGVILSRKKYGIDVREMGSGNIGATNITRVFGWYAGVLVFFVDYLKGFLPLYFLHKYFPEDPWLLVLVAFSLVLGHCFSIYLKFKGGKGVATSFGCVSFISPGCAVVCAVVYGLLLAVTKISAIGSLGAILAAIIFLLITQPPRAVSFLIIGITFVVVVRHRQNIQRLLETWKQKKAGEKK